MNLQILTRLLLAFAFPFFLSLRAAEYAVIDLGPGTAWGLNDVGVVVGGDDTNGFTFQNRVRTPTPPLVAYLPEVNGGINGPWYPLLNLKWTGINNAGMYVGTAVLSNLWQSVAPFVNRRPNPIIWDGASDLRVPVIQETALAINSSGVAAGGGFGAFRVIGSEVQFFPFPPMQSAFDINDSGVIVGVGRATGNSVEQAAMWTEGVTRLLDLPVGSFYRFAATAINSAGQIAGNRIYDRPGAQQFYSEGFLWSETETVYFGTGGNGNDVTVSDLNDSGVVVGQWKKSLAIIYRQGTMTDLNTLIPTGGWVLTAANAINEQGQIVGAGLLNGSPRAFLLNPLDPGKEPPSILTQPQGGTFGLGESTTLNVAANGTPPLTYQWQLNGTNLVGETAANLTLASLDAGDTGAYRVIIRNAVGEAFSNEAVVTVLDPQILVRRYAGIDVTGAVGGRYEIQASPSLITPVWSPLVQLTLTNSPQVWIDLESGTNQGPRFYRSVRILP